MAFTPIVIGSLAWGTPVNNALTSQDNRITTLENRGGSSTASLGFIATPYDPAQGAASSALTSGTVYMMRMDLAAPATLTTSTITLITAGATLTAAQNFVGLYDSTGARVALTADQSAAWTTTGEKNAAFTSPYAAAAGTYYLALLSNGTTPIGPMRTNPSPTSAAAINHGLSNATGRWATGPTAQTTLPASITMASRTLTHLTFWFGVS